ncbi:MAG: response regulator [Clostridia bacterium]
MYKLLVVDDEPLIRKGIISLIDYRELAVDGVFEAADGISALKIAGDVKPDIVLADINMPGMDGLEFASRVREINPSVRIAIITGYDYFDYAVAAIKAGVDDFVLKPVSKADITAILSKLIYELDRERSTKEAVDSIEKLADIGGDRGNESGYRRQIAKVMDDKYRDSEFSLRKLAAEVSLSPGYLSTLFKDIFGITFHDYLTSLRLERAKILLLSSDLKNYEVAAQVGFEDPNYFSTAFKRRFGKPPGEYRGSAGGGK